MKVFSTTDFHKNSAWNKGTEMALSLGQVNNCLKQQVLGVRSLAANCQGFSLVRRCRYRGRIGHGKPKQGSMHVMCLREKMTLKVKG